MTILPSRPKLGKTRPNSSKLVQIIFEHATECFRDFSDVGRFTNSDILVFFIIIFQLTIMIGLEKMKIVKIKHIEVHLELYEWKYLLFDSYFRNEK